MSVNVCLHFRGGGVGGVRYVSYVRYVRRIDT